MGVDILPMKNMYARTANIQTTYNPCDNEGDFPCRIKANTHRNYRKEVVEQGKRYWYESLDKVKFQ